jgi:hypothetical protein
MDPWLMERDGGEGGKKKIEAPSVVVVCCQSEN